MTCPPKEPFILAAVLGCAVIILCVNIHYAVARRTRELSEHAAQTRAAQMDLHAAREECRRLRQRIEIDTQYNVSRAAELRECYRSATECYTREDARLRDRSRRHVHE